MPPVPPQKEYQYKYADSLWCIYLVSVVAAWNAEFLTYPLDLIKTRLQIQGELAKNGKSGKMPYRGMLQTALGITREEGVHRLWQGLHAACARHMVYSGTRIITYKALKEKMFKQKPGDNNFPLWQSAVCGVSAGAFSQYIASPADLLKVQLQMEGRRKLMGLPPRVTGLHDAFQKVWKTGGIRGLWKGSVPNVQRAALVNLGDLTTYDMAKRFIMKQTGLPDEHFLHILSSSCAGFVAASMGTPADVIKTRVMNQPFDDKGRGLLYRSSIDCLRQTVKAEGAGALYKGFIPIWMRMAPWSLSFWLTYEEVLSVMGAKSCCRNFYNESTSLPKFFDDTSKKMASSLNRSKHSKLRKFLNNHIPITGWLPKYTRKDIVADFIAGLTVGVTMMPQSIAYAGLAGLAPQYGLYTAFIGSFTYIFLGTIKEVSIGPTSLMAIITQSYVHGLPIECVVLLTFMAGLVELLMGILQLGFLVEFISSPITSGFTSASAVIIILAQLKPLLGIKGEKHDFLESVIEMFNHIDKTRLADASLGIGCIVVLFTFKCISRIKTNNRNLKKSLWFLGISKNAICVFVTSMFGMYLHECKGGAPFKLTGKVVEGLPSFKFPNLTAEINEEPVGLQGMIESLGWGVIVVPFVAVLANVAIAKSYCSDVVVDANQEMMTLGFCNLLGSCVQAMPSCGAFTRSAVASSSDVRTPLQGLYSASVIMLALSLLTPYFYYIPKATLAAVLITAASSLIDYEIFPKLWKTDKFDCVLTMFTFIVGVLWGVEKAIVSGALINMTLLLKVWTRPNIFTEVRSVREGRKYLYLKPELGLYYPTSDYLTEYIKKQHKNYRELPMVLDCENVLRIDYAGCKAIETMLNHYNATSVQLILLNVNQRIQDVLKTILNKTNLVCCQNNSDICDNAFDMPPCPDEIPLLLTMKVNLNKENDNERKLSLYDNV